MQCPILRLRRQPLRLPFQQNSLKGLRRTSPARESEYTTRDQRDPSCSPPAQLAALREEHIDTDATPMMSR